MNQLTSILALAAITSSGLAQADGQDVIRKTLDHYHALKGVSLTLKLDIEMEEGMDGGFMAPDDMDQVTQGVILKPNQFAFWPMPKKAKGMANDMVFTPWVYSDGKQMTSAMPAMKTYEETEAPESFDAMLGTWDEDETIGQVWQMVPGADLAIELMSSGKQSRTDEDDAGPVGFVGLLKDADYKGLIGEGKDAHHVFRIENPGDEFGNMTMEIYISDTDRPWVTALKPIDEEGQSGMPEGMSVTLRFDDWKPANEIPVAAKFTPDEGWKKVDDLISSMMDGALAGGEMDTPPESTPAPGANDAAANFSLETLDGDTFTLADHKGRVVVVDFWATWCGPCVAGLPVVSKVMADYADKGVDFVAVNLREGSDKVSKFMQKKKWNFTVALDRDGSVANRYGVTGIPHSVIIDQNGKIHSTHTGFGGADATDKMLRKELDSLIGG